VKKRINKVSDLLYVGKTEIGGKRKVGMKTMADFLEWRTLLWKERLTNGKPDQKDFELVK